MKYSVKFLMLLVTLLLPTGLFADPSIAPWRNSLVSMFDPYQKVVAENTRSAKHYSFSQLDTDYHWLATYHSPGFLVAVDDLLKKYYPNGLSPYAQQIRTGMAPEGQTEFFVAVYARSFQMRRLLGKKNFWQVQLIAGGEFIKPISVEEVEISPMYNQIYPYLTKWHKGYRVVFPFNPTTTAQKLTLEISGPLGSHQATFGGT